MREADGDDEVGGPGDAAGDGAGEGFGVLGKDFRHVESWNRVGA